VKGTTRVYELAAVTLSDAEDLFREFLSGTVLDGREFTVAPKAQCLLAWDPQQKGEGQ